MIEDNTLIFMGMVLTFCIVMASSCSTQDTGPSQVQRQLEQCKVDLQVCRHGK